MPVIQRVDLHVTDFGPRRTNLELHTYGSDLAVDLALEDRSCRILDPTSSWKPSPLFHKSLF
jgi:hypothetical protein